MLRHAENWIKHEITLKKNETVKHLKFCAERTNDWGSHNVRQYDSSQPEIKVILVFKGTKL